MITKIEGRKEYKFKDPYAYVQNTDVVPPMVPEVPVKGMDKNALAKGDKGVVVVEQPVT